MVFPFFTILGLFFLVIRFILKSPRRQVDLEHKAFWDRENKANCVRKQPLDDLQFIEIDEKKLPFCDTPANDFILECQNTIKALEGKKIVNLSGISNTDLKLRYGVANLDILSEYDENFLTLVRTLHLFGEAMDKEGDIASAIRIFEYAVSIGSDVRSDYKYLASKYHERFDFEAINSLIEAADKVQSNNGRAIAKMLKDTDYFKESF